MITGTTEKASTSQCSETADATSTEASTSALLLTKSSVHYSHEQARMRANTTELNVRELLPTKHWEEGWAHLWCRPKWRPQVWQTPQNFRCLLIKCCQGEIRRENSFSLNINNRSQAFRYVKMKPNTWPYSQLFLSKTVVSPTNAVNAEPPCISLL